MNKLLWIALITLFITTVLAAPAQPALIVVMNILILSSGITIALHWDNFMRLFDVFHNYLPFDALRNDTPPQVIRVVKVDPEIWSAGYVYLLKEVNGIHYKIGHTRNPENRRKTFNVKLPFETAYICLIASDDMCQLEASLHHMFAHRRVNGEWFALQPADVDYIRSLAQE